MAGDRFRLGVNYWPARTAMSWWSQFDAAEVGADFARIAACGLDSVRVFLTWEEFQPTPNRVERTMLDRLVAVADLAGESGLTLLPTLFTGHMSGVNWIPEWALGGSDGDDRFRVIAGGRVAEKGLRNWFTDTAVGDAQALLAAETVAALRGHEALWAWDLGNENSNCVIPPSSGSARTWLERLTSAVRRSDDRALLTVGLHMEDLEEDRRLGPREAAGSCDFLSMHGYPIYASWAEGPLDEQLLPFLARLTRWLGNGRDVLFSEFGLPTSGARRTTTQDPRLVDEDAAAVYTVSALEALRDAGCLGAMLWCYSDYHRSLWSSPPLDLAKHERSFGLWRADGSPKPAVAAVAAFAGTARRDPDVDDSWIDLGPNDFLLDPGRHLPRLYRRYRHRSS
jgi:endo-1,4-beta-mannosidase